MAAQKARRYTREERKSAVELAGELGPAESARRLGIPSGTVNSWCHLARKAVAAGLEWPPLPEPSPDEDASEAELAEALKKPEPGPKKVARVYTPSERARALELAARKGVTAAAKELGISRFSLYDWRRKVARAAAGEGDSPTSGPDPKDIKERRDQEILAVWREHPGLGPSQVRNQLRRKGIKVSTATTRRVMEDAGYRPPNPRRQGHDARFEAIRPNHCWHLDFVQRWIGRASTFTLILIDDFSRFVVGHGVDDAERADLVVQTFEEAVNRHGKPEMVLHDKGSAFGSWKGISRFTRLLEELDVAQIVCRAQGVERQGRGLQRQPAQGALRSAPVLRRGRDEAAVENPPPLVQVGITMLHLAMWLELRRTAAPRIVLWLPGARWEGARTGRAGRGPRGRSAREPTARRAGDVPR